MLDLNVIREQIDGIDKQLVDLFEQRMKLTKEVAEYKIQTGKKVLDTQRERAKIEAVTKLVKNEANVHAIDDLFSQIMANSRPYICAAFLLDIANLTFFNLVIFIALNH
jgi:chorismate mutase / prephenate dehydratase